MDKLNLVIDNRNFTIYYESNIPKLNIKIDQIDFINNFVDFQNEFGKKFDIKDYIKLSILYSVFQNWKLDYNGFVKLPIWILLKKTYPILHVIWDIDLRWNLKKMKLVEMKYNDKSVYFKISERGHKMLGLDN